MKTLLLEEKVVDHYTRKYHRIVSQRRDASALIRNQTLDDFCGIMGTLEATKNLIITSYDTLALHTASAMGTACGAYVGTTTHTPTATSCSQPFFQWDEQESEQQLIEKFLPQTHTSSWKEALHASAQQKISSYASFLGDAELTYKEKTISLSKKEEKEKKQGRTKIQSLDEKPHIIGNAHAIDLLRKGLRGLLLYNPLENKNVLYEFGGFPKSYLLWGKEGCGKTTLVEAVLKEAQHLAEQNLTALNIVTITNNIKTKYYGESAERLREILTQIQENKEVYTVVIDDIDTIFGDRQRDEHSQDRAVLSELMTFLEGAFTKNKGNYVVIATTNYPLLLDPALKRRFDIQLDIKGPETSDEYSSLLQMKLSRAIELDLVRTSAWKDIGVRMLAYNFRGSDVRDVATHLLLATYPSFSEEIYQENEEEKRTMIREGMKPIQHEAIITAIEQKQKEKVLQEENDDKRELEKLVKQYKLQRTAQGMLHMQKQ